MRLLVVSHYMPPHEGGIERIAEAQTTAAIAAGHEVVWVASREPGGSASEETVDGCRRVRVPCWNGLERTFGVPYPVWLGDRGPIDRWVAWADVVHVHDLLYPGTSLALAAARRHHRPSLLTQHIGFVAYRSRVLRSIERIAYRTVGRRNAALADRWAWYNPGARDWLHHLARDRRRPSVYLPNAVDSELFRPARDDRERADLRRKHGLPVDRVIVLFVGRLVEKKGAPIVVASAGSSHHTLLVGERGRLAFESGPHLELRPFVTRIELAELLRAADVLALPSIGEGFPLVAQEAMASGLAVALGRDPNYADLVDEGAILLVEPTIDEFRAVVARLVADPRERTALGQGARQCALARWAPAACQDRLLAVYRGLAGESGRLAGGSLPG